MSLKVEDISISGHYKITTTKGVFIGEKLHSDNENIIKLRVPNDKFKGSITFNEIEINKNDFVSAVSIGKSDWVEILSTLPRRGGGMRNQKSKKKKRRTFKRRKTTRR